MPDYFKRAKNAANRVSKKASVGRAFHEMKVRPPRILAKTRKKFGKARAERQRVAIGLSKARRGDY